MADDLAFLDATAQAELVRSGQASPTELVEAAIARIEAVNPDVNAVVHPRFERAREEAAGDLPDGPFRGVPMLLKDLDGFQAGEPYHAGTRFLKERGYVADHDTELTARFLRAGLVPVGRTNTPELGLLITTEPEAYGPARNPWNTGHSTGGSSGGSAAAVAAGMVPVAHAGDGGGSIRIPASECGLVGLMPSRGRISLGPEVGEAWGGLVRRLVVSRSVRDTAGMLDAVHGPLPGDPYWAEPPARPYLDELGADPGHLSIGFTTEVPAASSAQVDPEVVAAVESTASLLGELGHRVERGQPDALLDTADMVMHFVTCLTTWTAAEVDSLAARVGDAPRPGELEAGTEAVVEMGRATTGVQLQQARDFLHGWSRQVIGWWGQGHDVLVTPTIPVPPPELGSFKPEPDNPLAGLFRAGDVVIYTQPFNITGQPAISLPLHWTEAGLPVGVQLVAAPGREDVLLGLAAQLEAARPWADRLPPVHA